ISESRTVAAGKCFQARIASMFSSQSRERIRRLPNACLLRVDVRKASQNSPAMSRSTWESIHVQQIIAFVEGGLAGLFRFRPETRVIQGPTGCIRSQKLRKELDRVFGIISHHLVHARADCRVRGSKSSQEILLRAIGNVFVERGIAQSLGDQE